MMPDGHAIEVPNCESGQSPWQIGSALRPDRLIA